jgi:membrane-bound ClpP family serine protease
MSSILQGPLANAIFAGFKDRLLVGTHRRETLGTTLDEYGDPTGSTVTTTAVQGFVSGYNEFFRATAGIPDTDVKVNIFAKSAPDLVPTKDDLVLFNSVWYQIRSVRVDPATALWTCQSFVTEAPV